MNPFISSYFCFVIQGVKFGFCSYNQNCESESNCFSWNNFDIKMLIVLAEYHKTMVISPHKISVLSHIVGHLKMAYESSQHCDFWFSMTPITHWINVNTHPITNAWDWDCPILFMDLGFQYMWYMEAIFSIEWCLQRKCRIMMMVTEIYMIGKNSLNSNIYIL